MINYGKVDQRHFATLNLEHKESLYVVKLSIYHREKARFQLTSVELLSLKNEPLVIYSLRLVNLRARRPSSSQENAN